MSQPQIAVIGDSQCSEDVSLQAQEVGRLVARRGAVLVCGGLSGVMEAASKGASQSGGVVLGILPGANAQEANPYVTYKVVTNMGHSRNIIIAHSADALIAVCGKYGTLSEMAIALKLGKPVISLNSWQPGPDVIIVHNPQEAVDKAFAALGK